MTNCLNNSANYIEILWKALAEVLNSSPLTDLPVKVHRLSHGPGGVREAGGELHEGRHSEERGAEHHEPQTRHSGLRLSQTVGEDRSLAVLGL